MTIVVFCRASHFFYKIQCHPTPPNPWIHGPRLAQGLLQGLDDEAGGIWLHIHFGLAVPGLHQAGCFQHHGGLGVIKSKVSLRAGEGSTIFSMHKMMAMIMS